jgi:hypothetical protein
LRKIIDITITGDEDGKNEKNKKSFEKRLIEKDLTKKTPLTGASWLAATVAVPKLEKP